MGINSVRIRDKVSAMAEIVGGESIPQKPVDLRSCNAGRMERCSFSCRMCRAVCRETWVTVLLVDTTVTVIMSA